MPTLFGRFRRSRVLAIIAMWAMVAQMSLAHAYQIGAGDGARAGDPLGWICTSDGIVPLGEAGPSSDDRPAQAAFDHCTACASVCGSACLAACDSDLGTVPSRAGGFVGLGTVLHGARAAVPVKPGRGPPATA